MGRRETPVPEGPLRDFAQALRELRTRAPGTPTYRELAHRARYSPSALSDAASGRRLPSWDVTAAYVAACGGDVEQWRARWEELNTRLRADAPALLAELTLTEAGEGADTEALDEAEAMPSATAGPDEPAGSDGHDASVASRPPNALEGSSGSNASAATGAAGPAGNVAPLSRSDPARTGPFRLLGRLGGGAMGQVYLGVSRTGRPVAVKIVRADLAEDTHFRERFAAEVAAARRVHGPFTPAVVDADTEAERPWLATTWVPGPALDEAVEAGGPLPAAVVLALAAGVAEALAAFHAAGILHRDLKPGNILLDVDGPKVIDFGVARSAEASKLTRTGEHVGTVPFMAPEQAAGTPVTGAADVFALGCVLAYAATGTTPFGHGPSGEVLYRVAHADPDPSALDITDPVLRDLVERCLAKDPARRPSPQEIIDAGGGDHPEDVAWLPTAAATRYAARREEVSTLLARAATRRTVVRVKLSAVPLILATGVAVALAATTPGSTPSSPPQAKNRSTAPYTVPYPSASASPHPSAGANTPTSATGTRTTAGPNPGSNSSPHPSHTTAADSGGGTGSGSNPGGAAGTGTVKSTVPWTGYSSQGCSSPGAAQTSFYHQDGTADWKSTTGGDYEHSCDGAKYRKLTGDTDWTANADWVFHPRTGVTGCTFTIHIAKGTWADQAQYKVYNVDSTNIGNANFFAHFTLPQHDYDAGGWYTTRRFTDTTGTIDLALTNAGPSGPYGVVADIVTATCS
ncbi:protein kinase [Streptomyces sp. NPDC013172]|uniref:protein kinase domain-containing protein n=1 Tax=Streptomyces sp. NPDC013172 TaxID=3155009 RepID=UPI003406456A